MHNWKTSVAGVVAAAAPIIAQAWPKYAPLAQAVSSLALLLLGWHAADKDKAVMREADDVVSLSELRGK